MSEKYSNGSKFTKEEDKDDSELAGENGQDNAASHKANEYVKELLAEKVSIEEGKLPNAVRLLDQEVTKVQTTGRPFRETKFVNVYRGKPTKVTAKVLVPSREYPKFNFVGQLLGPKGSSMKRLQEETMCRMTILGKGSMRDQAKEEELRNSLDPKYSHLSDNLHVEISAVAPPAEAHARVAFALAEIRKYLVPDLAENIRQEQFRDMEYTEDRPRRPPPPSARPSGPPRPPPSHPAMRMPNRGPPRGAAPPPKNRMSIMNRVRPNMDESYGYDDDYDTPSPSYNYNSPRANNQYDEYDDYNNGGNSNYEVTKVQAMGRAPVKENKFVDIYREKPIKVTVRVLVPVREHPKFNFVGKLLGPKGNSLKRLQEETMCKMAVLGKGSMKDRAKEDELRNSLDPKYSHLTEDLHVEISALGPPAEAHARVAFALAEVRKYLIPDNNDNIRQEQMREMEAYTGEEDRDSRSRRTASAPRSSAAPRPPPPPAMRTATRGPVPTPRVMPAKTKIMSILDRARVAMEESYGYDDDYGSSSPSYNFSSSRPTTHTTAYSSGYYDDYDDYYKGSSSSYDYYNRGYSNQSRQNRQRNQKQSNWNSSPSKKVG